jgi:hypothetical protein
LEDSWTTKEDAASETRKSSTSSAIREMQIKTTLRFHLTPVRVAVIKRTKNAGKDARKKERLYTLERNVK